MIRSPARSSRTHGIPTRNVPTVIGVAVTSRRVTLKPDGIEDHPGGAQSAVKGQPPGSCQPADVAATLIGESSE